MHVKKIAKGCLVRINADRCFTEENGGQLEYPLTNYYNDEKGIVHATRPVTKEETTDWYESDASKGVTSGGDTKLPPRTALLEVKRDQVYQVLRARCRVSLGYGNPVPGMLQLLDTETGEAAYVKRDWMEAV
jgi:hypothetical protein